MQTPDILFKYQAFTPDALSNLSNRQIWFSRPAKFNDPFDCAIHICRNRISDLEYQQLFNLCRIESGDPASFDRQYLNSKSAHFRNSVEGGLGGALEKRLSTMQNERGVCCFSECNDNILMWSHYADCHRGFCLGFKTDSAPFSGAFPVQYKKDIPVASPASVLLEDFNSTFMAMITVKADWWAYEREWRLFHLEADKAYGYGAGDLISLYFGALMPESQRLVIGKLLHGTGVRLYRMLLDSAHFRIHAEPLTFIPAQPDS